MKESITALTSEHTQLENSANWWNMLDQLMVNAPRINVFKPILSKITDNQMGFYMDWCAQL